MPKSKRDKKISLTKVGKKTHEFKEKIVEDVKQCLEKYDSVYLLTFSNLRNSTMQHIREEWKPSRFFFGKNKVMAIGLGRTEEEEPFKESHKLSECLRGQCGLLFTNSKKKEVIDWFESVNYPEYARSGFKTTERIELKQGPLEQFSHAIEPYLRQLGMPTSLERGVVTLLRDFEVCKEGAVLTPEQAKILELLDIRLAKLKFTLKAMWNKKKGFVKLAEDEEEIDEEVENNTVEDVEMEEEPVAKKAKKKQSKK